MNNFIYYIRNCIRNSFVVMLAAVLGIALICVPQTVHARPSDNRAEERQTFINAGYKEVSVSEAKRIATDYYYNRSMNSKPEKIFCEGDLSAELEKLYTGEQKLYDSYQQAAVSAYIKYDQGNYYVAYEMNVEYSNFRQGDMSDYQYDTAMAKATQLSYDFNYGSTRDKVERTYDWLCDNLEYDDTMSKGSIYDALIMGDTVCTGYATGFQVIMEAMGIESYLCIGKVDGAYHSWNAVNIDGKYYFVDATYGDTSKRPDSWMLFGTDRRVNETSLNIVAVSEVTEQDELIGVLIVVGIVMTIGMVILAILVIVIVKLATGKKPQPVYRAQGYGAYPPQPLQTPLQGSQWVQPPQQWVQPPQQWVQPPYGYGAYPPQPPSYNQYEQDMIEYGEYDSLVDKKSDDDGGKDNK